jgi:hypothetical protein
MRFLRGAHASKDSARNFAKEQKKGVPARTDDATIPCVVGLVASIHVQYYGFAIEQRWPVDHIRPLSLIRIVQVNAGVDDVLRILSNVDQWT